MSTVYVVKYESERQPNKTERSLARRLLRQRIEPEPKYHTGKFWTD